MVGLRSAVVQYGAPLRNHHPNGEPHKLPLPAMQAHFELLRVRFAFKNFLLSPTLGQIPSPALRQCSRANAFCTIIQIQLIENVIFSSQFQSLPHPVIKLYKSWNQYQCSRK